MYSDDEQNRWFLERFLSIVQTEWDNLERQIEDFSRYMDPAAVPEGAFLEYLARWLALPLEGDWTDEQKRNLLEIAPEIYPQRGTLKGLRRFLQIYLQNISGLTPEEQGAFPQIIEGFRERAHLLLDLQDLAKLGGGAPLWGPGFVDRLQLDVFANEGEVKLVSTGDPERDLFHKFAHRFRVFVPAAFLGNNGAEQKLRRAVESEKPAHTDYDLCIVEPLFQVGIQSTIGLDTIIAVNPATRLQCRHEMEMKPNHTTHSILGLDTVLTGQEDYRLMLQPDPGFRAGIDTIIK
jgi:phage tail-like protein